MATYVITEACVGVKDASCVDVCPAACIHTTPDAPQYYIDPEICIACEQCFFVCPVDAIFLETNLPADLNYTLEINAAFFRQNKPVPQPITAERAQEVAAAIHAYAAKEGLLVAVVVADPKGEPMVTVRMDGATAEADEQARNKAYTAANLQVATHQIARGYRGADRSAETLSASFDKSRMATEPGGYPIMADESTMIGAIGVAGNANAQHDLQCCQAGLAILRDAAAH